ncbi:MAG TPA: TerB family tellurite resistance protein [Polaromonas sp.]|uniref:TerB family tellurite resistance protein n=1 Tax=Polaromonas sp. TaxID=1869339 RepID=UPI002D6A6F5C|nr:TerB family tellurite resistance protein [Polaromonas sp.]HYW56560.1 TerB family tellurite resistance protein [Polaromonas sp.]
MRSYPQNSPHAAARIVALAMLADGNICKEELDTRDRINAHEQLGLDKDGFHATVHSLCEDLLAAAHASWGTACRVDPDMLEALMKEIDAPELQSKVIRLCVAVVEADTYVADSESVVLLAALEHWGAQLGMQTVETP